MATLHASRRRRHGEGAFAHLLRVAREGDSAATPLVLLAVVGGALTVVVGVVLVLALIVERLA